MLSSVLFPSFFLGGFECSTHRRHDGRRLDLIDATAHDRLVVDDYRAMGAHGIRAVRDGIRWHLVERMPGRYDWASLRPMATAAREQGLPVIWDLLHYGWPDHLDIWRPAFVDRFARFAAAAVRELREVSDDIPYFCPVNEISYWAWAGGDMAHFNPMARGRGMELKCQLVRAAIAAIEAIRAIEPRARFVTAEPIINVVPHPERPHEAEAAENYRLAQFEALDMLSGARWPQLGGRPEYLDVVGVNFYSDNQWFLGGETIPPGAPHYSPLHEMLAETWQRYGRPMLISETGMEGPGRADWLLGVCDQVRYARIHGVPIEGVCLYPVLDYPGWSNERYCETGLLSNDGSDRRSVYAPLAAALAQLQTPPPAAQRSADTLQEQRYAGKRA